MGDKIMMKIYIYEKDSKKLVRQVFALSEYIHANVNEGESFTLTPPPDFDRVWRWVEDKWVELLPINNPSVPYGDEYIWDEKLKQWVECPELSAHKFLEQQEQAWQQIKQRRYEAITSGVYVESVDKWFHTDGVSATTYSTIAGMIALDNYEPLQWKTMDNTWLLLTEPLFKELQTAMSQKTNANYAVAEQHKAAMLEADNPLDYDYSGNWV